MKQITYLKDPNSDIVYSRVGSEVAIPVLDYEGMTPANNFKTNYYLEKYDVIHVCKELRYMKGTKKIPTVLKNIHRKFWGMKLLKG